VQTLKQAATRQLPPLLKGSLWMSLTPVFSAQVQWSVISEITYQSFQAAIVVQGVSGNLQIATGSHQLILPSLIQAATVVHRIHDIRLAFALALTPQV
jgi:hypothetical protein